jgi:hypothetical protein
VVGIGALSQDRLARAFAFSPDALVHGRMWLLPLSGSSSTGTRRRRSQSSSRSPSR